MKENKCCSVDVTETEKGLKVELVGDKVKECLTTLMSCCCRSKAEGSKKSGK